MFLISDLQRDIDVLAPIDAFKYIAGVTLFHCIPQMKPIMHFLVPMLSLCIYCLFSLFMVIESNNIFLTVFSPQEIDPPFIV